MQIAEANRIALAALRAVLGAAHPFELSIGDKAIRVSPRAPQVARWPKGPEGLEEQKDGPWPPSVLLDCEWAGGRVTLEMRAAVWRNKRYYGWLALQVVTSPLNREIIWSSLAQRILTDPGPLCAVLVSLTLFAREGDKDTKRLLASLIAETRALGLDAISPATFRLFDVVLSRATTEPEPPEAFARVVRAALAKLPYFVRGEESDVEGTIFVDIHRLPSPPQPPASATPTLEKSPLPESPTAPSAADFARIADASTQEDVFFDDIAFDNLAGFRHFAWEDIGRLNVIVGANDTGKSHLLKMLYVLARSVQEYTARIESDRPAWREVLADKLLWTFQPASGRLGDLVRHNTSDERLAVNATLCNELYGFGLGTSAGRADSDWDVVTEDVRPQPGVSALFIPPKEVLTSFDAIAAVREQLKRFGFDDTYYDLVVALRGEPIQADLPDEFQRVLSNLEELLTGHIETEHGRFVFKREGDRFDMPQVAEGIKKIGIFTRLIQNGSLRRNSILFIDEPETNLHPRAARALVNMLYDLSQAGVQIYIATHSYFVLKQFELIARKHKTPVQLCCLSRDGNTIASKFFDLQGGMPENGIVEESLRLYDEDVDVGMGS